MQTTMNRLAMFCFILASVLLIFAFPFVSRSSAQEPKIFIGGDDFSNSVSFPDSWVTKLPSQWDSTLTVVASDNHTCQNIYISTLLPRSTELDGLVIMECGLWDIALGRTPAQHAQSVIDARDWVEAQGGTFLYIFSPVQYGKHAGERKDEFDQVAVILDAQVSPVDYYESHQAWIDAHFSLDLSMYEANKFHLTDQGHWAYRNLVTNFLCLSGWVTTGFGCANTCGK